MNLKKLRVTSHDGTKASHPTLEVIRHFPDVSCLAMPRKTRHQRPTLHLRAAFYTLIAAISVIACPAVRAQSVGNSSFETPPLGAGNFQYSPSGATWVWGGGTGISGNGSGFTSGHVNAPLGTQVAFLQGGGGFSQDISGFTVGAGYTLTFSASQRSGNNQTWQVLVNNVAVGSYTPGSGATTYTDYAATFTASATTLTLKFLGTNANGGDNTAFIDNIRLVANSSGPAAPSNLSSYSAWDLRADLTWSDNSSDETGFKLERKTGAGGTYAQIAVISAGWTSCIDNTVSPGTMYSYRMRATNASGDSTYSNETSVTTTGTPPVTIVAPSNIAANSVWDTRADVSWNDNSNNETGFKLERKTGPGGTYAQIAVISANWTSCIDNTVSPGTLYYYRIRATNGALDSTYSSEASVTTTGTPVTINPPSNLVANASNPNHIDLGWSDNSNNETNFKLERKTGSGGAYAQIQLVSPDWTSSWDSSVSAGTTYSYRIRATNSNGDSAYSNEATVTTPGGPSLPASNMYQIEIGYWDGYGTNFASTYVFVSDAGGPANNAPAISSVTASPSSVAAGGSVNLSCSASDADGDGLKYMWVATAGQLGWTQASADTWKAPTVPGTYAMKVMVGDGKTWTAGTVDITVTGLGNNVSPGNHVAAITSIVPSSVSVHTGDTVTLTATENDVDPHPNGDHSWMWFASAGTISGNNNTATWTAPSPSADTKGRTVKPGFIVWPRLPADFASCPFPLSTSIVGVGMTGRAMRTHISDTWMPTWANDDKLYSPWQDGGLTTPPFDQLPENWPVNLRNGWAKLEGSDPQDLMTTNAGLLNRVPMATPSASCYPGACFSKDGVLYYGVRIYQNYDINGNPTPNNTEATRYRMAVNPFIGFHTSADGGNTWTMTTHTETSPLFNEPDKHHLKFGQLFMVDFGKNQQYSPDGKIYFISTGSVASEAFVNPVNDDSAYLCRVLAPNVNNGAAYEFYSGNGNWSNSIGNAVPIAHWPDHFSCATIVYNPGLNKFIMSALCQQYISSNNGQQSTWDTDDNYILESSSLTGPYNLVTYWTSYGPQAYYGNIPSKFISSDGKTAWYWYGANFWPSIGALTEDPPASGYRLTQQQIRFLTPADLQ